MVAGKDNLLETDVYNHEAGHAAKHNATNEQLNWVTDQLANPGANPELSASFVGKSTTKAAGAASTIVKEVADPGRTASKWREVYDTGVFNTHNDPNLFIGWNADKASGGGDAAEPALYMGFEADYYDSATTRTVEWYVGVLRADSSGPQFRPFAFTAARDGNLDLTAAVQIDIGTGAHEAVGSDRSQFNVIAGGPSILTVTPTAVGMSKPLTLSAAGGYVQVASGGMIVNSTATDAAHIYFNRRGVNRWYIANFDGDAAHYLWDAIGGSYATKYTTGANATARIMEVNASLKVVGNLGFYGTTPTTKPTVTGSRGANAALTSLLTGLASLGLIVDSSS